MGDKSLTHSLQRLSVHGMIDTFELTIVLYSDYAAKMERISVWVLLYSDSKRVEWDCRNTSLPIHEGWHLSTPFPIRIVTGLEMFIIEYAPIPLWSECSFWSLEALHESLAFGRCLNKLSYVKDWALIISYTSCKREKLTWMALGLFWSLETLHKSLAFGKCRLLWSIKCQSSLKTSKANVNRCPYILKPWDIT